MKKYLFLILSLFIFSPLKANEFTELCAQRDLGALAILQAGRVKPLSVHAGEVLYHLTLKRSFQGKSATEVYCLLSAEYFGASQALSVSTNIEHRDVQGLLQGRTQISIRELSEKREMLVAEWRRQEFNDSYKKSLRTLISRIDLYQHVLDGQNWFVPKLTRYEVEEKNWQPLSEAFSSQEEFISFLNNTADINHQYTEIEGAKHLLEYRMMRMRLPWLATAISLLSLAALVAFKGLKVGVSLALLSVLLQTIYMALRVVISGRAPITNMYETVIFSGYAALILGLIIGGYRREKMLMIVGVIYSMMTLLMINFAHGMLSPSISPLVPVLRDNFWLSTHVTTIIVAYGAFALSWILANIALVKRRVGKLDLQEEKYVSDLIYTTLKYGNTLLFAGIILGGIWADYSWGRFWGWDPKETWSLIVFTLYMAIIHGKYTSWIPNRRFLPFVAGAFMSVMMAWFGVNYILATGLHSYGFSEGGAIFLGSFFFLQTLFLVLFWPRKNHMPALRTT